MPRQEKPPICVKMGLAMRRERKRRARNPDGIAAFGGGFSDPPTQVELVAFAAYVETLRVALVRV